MKPSNFTRGTWSLFKRWDKRLVVLIALAFAGVAAVAGVIVWVFTQSNSRLQFGDPVHWSSHITEINNIAFRYPDAMEVIVPKNEKENPVSIVKKGERGDSVLMQVGTWRLGDSPPQNLPQVEERYEKRFPTARPIRKKEHFMQDGREGVLYVQDAEGGLRIVEVFFWDREEIREISLQLPKLTKGPEWALWEDAFRQLVSTIDFVVDEVPQNRPADIPFTWRYFENREAGFSIWYPPHWIEEQYQKPDTPVWLAAHSDAQSVIVHPKNNPDSASYIIHSFPQDEPTRLTLLDAFLGRPFRNSAVEGSLLEGLVGIPHVGAARSFEARQPMGGNNVVTYLLLIVATPTLDERGTPVNYEEPGRGFVIVNSLPEGKSQDTHSEDIRLMTTTLRIVK